MPTLGELLPGGLRWRLTAWVAGVMLISAAAIFLVVYSYTGTQLRRQIDRDLASDTTQLAQALRPYAGRSARTVAAGAGRYVNGQPYTATSTLLFALVPGQATVSNHPEVFGSSVPENGEPAREQTAENAIGRALTRPRLGYFTDSVPDVGRMRIRERAVRLGSLTAVVGASEPLAPVERAQHGIAAAFVLAGGIILALALLVSYLAGARVSAPLRRMASVAARVDGGELEPRMDVARLRRLDELRVLGESFNHMLDRLAAAFRAQRDFVADASHELRTPLTVMRGQLEVLVAQDNPPAEEVRRVEALLQAEVSRMARLVDDLLSLAKAETPQLLRPERIDVASFVTDFWEAATASASRRFELGPVPAGTLRADPDRLTQALRNLVDNAIAHTAEGSGLVALDVERVPGGAIRFAVSDDGPGIAPAERERVFERLHRTDSSRSRSAGGAGLGLAIVRAVAETHGGQVRAVDVVPTADRSPAGPGVRMELVLPGFAVARATGGRADAGRTAMSSQGDPGRMAQGRADANGAGAGERDAPSREPQRARRP